MSHNQTQANSAQGVAIVRSGAMPSSAGNAEWYSGNVRVDPLFAATAPARASAALVTFEPGARTDWHTHPLGQQLIVTAGCGRIQQWGQAVQDIHPGDVVTIPPGVKHWHGAGLHTAMSHIAIQEQLENKAVDWLERVDEESSALA
ncbi:cupin domain-containing protein [Chromobacterium subtsugae]|uniref:(R)-mandelonitrile lyase n=1 Tax=Chromobacterium subtsugae TaxID=251747 RepID=UPI000AC14FE2|nr:cupin domain-containing protein [Chromobacterium subtsugae]